MESFDIVAEDVPEKIEDLIGDKNVINSLADANDEKTVEIPEKSEKSTNVEMVLAGEKDGNNKEDMMLQSVAGDNGKSTPIEDETMKDGVGDGDGAGARDTTTAAAAAASDHEPAMAGADGAATSSTTQRTEGEIAVADGTDPSGEADVAGVESGALAFHGDGSSSKLLVAVDGSHVFEVRQ